MGSITLARNIWNVSTRNWRGSLACTRQFRPILVTVLRRVHAGGASLLKRKEFPSPGWNGIFR